MITAGTGLTLVAGAAWAAPVVAGERASFSVPGNLTGVVALSASNAWVVGSVGPFGGQGTLVAHWNGKSWKRVSAPSPGQDTDLNAVAASSGRDVWAVGDTEGKTLILHWNGRSWKRVPSPSPAADCELMGVTAVSARNAWAVGFADPSGGDVRPGPSASGKVTIARTLILHWNGKKWQRVPSPNPDEGGHLAGVSATSASNAWAVGSDEFKTVDFGNLFLHWNGHSWKQVNGPNPPGNDNTLLGVAASGSSAWAVGEAKHEFDLDHWTGTKWKQVLRSRTSGPEAVTDRTPASTWAVGVVGNGALILRLHGAAWQRVATPHPAGESLIAVAASSSRSAWAVGTTSGNSDSTLILHWNGSRWSS